jgi:hypothetical protein
MKDCKTFLKLQEAAVNKQAEAKKQGYIGNTSNTPTLVEKSLLVAHHFGICVAHMGCATTATPQITVYWWRMSICATHMLNIGGAYSICAISVLCMAHIAICSTNT